MPELLNIVPAILQLTFKVSTNGPGEGLLVLKKLLEKEKNQLHTKIFRKKSLLEITEHFYRYNLNTNQFQGSS